MKSKSCFSLGLLEVLCSQYIFSWWGLRFLECPGSIPILGSLRAVVELSRDFQSLCRVPGSWRCHCLSQQYRRDDTTVQKPRAPSNHFLLVFSFAFSDRVSVHSSTWPETPPPPASAFCVYTATSRSIQHLDSPTWFYSGWQNRAVHNVEMAESRSLETQPWSCLPELPSCRRWVPFLSATTQCPHILEKKIRLYPWNQFQEDSE